MSNIENLTAELCDQLMQKASSGDLDCVKKSVAMLIEYSAFEVARHQNSRASVSLLEIAKQFEDSFPVDEAT